MFEVCLTILRRLKGLKTVSIHEKYVSVRNREMK